MKKQFTIQCFMALVVWAVAGCCMAQEKAAFERGYYYISTEVLLVSPSLAQAVCAADAEQDWAIQALREALEKGSATRLLSQSGGFVLLPDRKNKNTLSCMPATMKVTYRNFNLRYYLSKSGVSLPEAVNGDDYGVSSGVMLLGNSKTPNLDITMNVVDGRSVEVDGVEMKLEQTAKLPLFDRRCAPLKPGVSIIRGQGAWGQVAVAVNSVKKIALPETSLLDSKMVFRLTLLESTPEELDRVKTQAKGFPYLVPQEYKQLLERSFVVKMCQVTPVGAYEVRSTKSFLGKYIADQAKEKAEAVSVAPKVLKVSLSETASVRMNEKLGIYRYEFNIGSFAVKDVQTKQGVLQLPTKSNLSLSGYCPLKRGDIMVLATQAEPVDCGSTGMPAIFSDVDPERVKELASSGEIEENAGADGENAKRVRDYRSLMLVLEVVK